MFTTLSQYTADHRGLVEAAAQAGGLTDPVAFDASAYAYPLLRQARRGPMIPFDGAITHSWTTGHRYFFSGIAFGLRTYKFQDISFVRCCAMIDNNAANSTYDFFVVSRADYLRLFRLVVRTQREKTESEQPPVLEEQQLAVLRQNTLGYLDRRNLQRIRELGGRPKRGLLLTGPPGNGKTSACRWLWKECTREGHEYRLVTPDAYRAARMSCNPVDAVKALFSVERRGVIFFDDMDIALRDRDTVKETDDQAVFLSALDGIEVNEGVVYVFTTNCSLDLIDPAFKRPGRIDLILHFEKPTAALRRQLMDRWHADIRAGIDLEAAADATEGFSFAEVEELKNLLILHYLDASVWNWDWAMQQFHINRADLTATKTRIGFPGVNGEANGHAHAEMPF